MKKIIKNILLTFVILFTILNLSLYVYNNISRTIFLKNTVIPKLNGEVMGNEDEMFKEEAERYKEIYGKDVPGLTLVGLNWYLMGSGQILEQETIILVASAVLGIVVGTIISLSEHSKIKHILYFVLLGLLLALIVTICNQWGNGNIQDFIDEFLFTIKDKFLCYIVIYFICFIICYYINKNKANELNKELKNKQK